MIIWQVNTLLADTTIFYGMSGDNTATHIHTYVHTYTFFTIHVTCVHNIM